MRILSWFQAYNSFHVAETAAVRIGRGEEVAQESEDPREDAVGADDVACGLVGQLGFGEVVQLLRGAQCTFQQHRMIVQHLECIRK